MRLIPIILTSVVLSATFGQTYSDVGTVRAVAADAAGNVFMGLSDHHIVLRWNRATGALTPVAGNGTFGYTGDNGPATSAQLSNPSAIAVDTEGNLYIADDYSDVIRKVTADGIITTVAGNGTAGFSGDNGPATRARLTSPSGIAVDVLGNIYIADLTNRIRRVSNGVITTVVGNGTSGFGGDGGPATSAQLTAPCGIAVDVAGNLYIADRSNRVRKVSNGIINTLAGNLTSGFSGDGGSARNAQLAGPSGVTVDAAGNVFIAEKSNRIREISSGVITTVAGTGIPGFTGDDGPAISAELASPSSLAVDSTGDLYIADQGNHRVRRVSNGMIATLAGSGSGAVNAAPGSVGNPTTSGTGTASAAGASTDLTDSAHLVRDNASSVMLGSYDMSGASWKPPTRTVATLPSASANAGRTFLVVDAQSSGDCTIGRGSSPSQCYSNGSGWKAMTTAPGPSVFSRTHSSFRALCQNTVSGANLSLLPGISSSPAAQNCDSGNYFGVLSFAANTTSLTSNDAYGMLFLPASWSLSSGVQANIKWRTAVTSGSVVFQLSGQCVSSGEVPGSFGPPLAFSPSRAAGVSNAWTDSATLTLTGGDVLAGCVPGGILLFRVFRDHTNPADTVNAGADLIFIDLGAIQ